MGRGPWASCFSFQEVVSQIENGPIKPGTMEKNYRPEPYKMLNDQQVQKKNV